MEATTPTAVASTDEAPPETTPNSSLRQALIALFWLVVLAGTGYVVFSGGGDGLKDNAAQSETVKKILVMIGMGPKAGWLRFVAPCLGCAAVAFAALAFLSTGGRDVKTEKERVANRKKPQRPVEPTDTPAAPVEEEEECNLSSYKLFKSLNEAASESSPTPAAASHQ